MHRNKKRKGEPPLPNNPQLISGHSGLLFVSIVLQKISSCTLWNICCYFKYILSSSVCNRLCLWEVLLWIQSAQLLQEPWTGWEEGAEPGSFSLRQNSLQLEHEAHSHSELFKTESFPNSAFQVVSFIFFFWSCLVQTLEGAFIQAIDY